MNHIDKEDLRVNAIQTLKKQIKELEIQSLHLQGILITLKIRLGNLKTFLDMTKSQLSSLDNEIKLVTINYHNANDEFSKDLCEEISKIKNPNTTLVNIAEKFLLILQQNDKSWKNFKIITKNFDYLKRLILGINPLELSESIMNDVLPIWQDYCSIQIKLRKYCKGVYIIAEWIKNIIEYKVRKDAFEKYTADHIR